MYIFFLCSYIYIYVYVHTYIFVYTQEINEKPDIISISSREVDQKLRACWDENLLFIYIFVL
jgi:hypothetical protein